ncbi:MAG: hypothetical protein LW875_09990 [Proteobacteria bacterium]|jgi:hypothetical protein|nr:hypothetical protein [Pseudomonadota bacterium]
MRELLAALLVLALSSSCAKKPSSEDDRSLYVASGTCYVGPLTATRTTSSTGSGLVSRISLSKGTVQSPAVIDYGGLAGQWPTGLVELDSDYFLVPIERTSGRRIDRVKKSGLSEFNNWSVDTTAISAQPRAIIASGNASFILSKSSGIEKFSSGGTSGARVGTAPFINAPVTPCATSTTLISSMVLLGNGNTLWAHAATGQNRLGISSSGTNCSGQIAAPTATQFPTGIAYLRNYGKILVTYASSVLNENTVWVYAVNEPTNTITSIGSAISSPDGSIIHGPSAITYDETTGSVYVANGSTSFSNNIEKFTFDNITNLLTRVTGQGGGPWHSATVNSQCVVGMLIAD